MVRERERETLRERGAPRAEREKEREREREREREGTWRERERVQHAWNGFGMAAARNNRTSLVGISLNMVHHMHHDSKGKKGALLLSPFDLSLLLLILSQIHGSFAPLASLLSFFFYILIRGSD
jgi:hypothetical protein